jgi:hypothetical protein
VVFIEWLYFGAVALKKYSKSFAEVGKYSTFASAKRKVP